MGAPVVPGRRALFVASTVRRKTLTCGRSCGDQEKQPQTGHEKETIRTGGAKAVEVVNALSRQAGMQPQRAGERAACLEEAHADVPAELFVGDRLGQQQVLQVVDVSRQWPRELNKARLRVEVQEVLPNRQQPEAQRR